MLQCFPQVCQDRMKTPIPPAPLPPSRPPSLPLGCLLNRELFAARTTASICAWSIEVISFACAYVSIRESRVTVVSPVDLCGYELYQLNMHASLCLSEWEKMNWQQTQSILFVCSLFTHVNTHARARQPLRVHLLVLATSFHLFSLPPSFRCILSTWKQYDG